MAETIDPHKIIANIQRLLSKATGRQLRLIYLVVYEILRE